uniref:Enoyl-CoA hydratase/3-hydroxypropionyl-coenzyme A dehydratase n=1 Tax=Candidatus Kentrum sp. TC TaxID=2126339 RepID=A0A450Y783_9GAMM|nr:MAG: enoyl-CoA hydratase/3-hydroxypropionyl-coenzyme A dehydratase [Candidatus Kentron sp. TC]
MERPEENIRLITLNRPKLFNTLDSRIMDELDSAIRETATDEDVRALLITGAGKLFSLGTDVIEMQNLDAMRARTLAQRGLRTLRKLER